MKKLAFAFAALSAAICLASPDSDAARASAQQYLSAIQKSDPVMLYNAMPASYRADLSGIVKLFGQKMDPEIWTTYSALIGEMAVAAEAKAELLAELSDDNDKAKPAPREKVDAIRSAAKAVRALSSSITIATLRNGDVGKILAAPELRNLKGVTSISGAGIKDPSKLSVAGVKPVENGFSINLKCAGATNETDCVFVKVDGAWVPNDLAKGWKESMDSARKSLADFSIKPETKQKLLQAAPIMKAAIQQAAAAKDAESLKQSAALLMMPIMMLGIKDDDAAPKAE